MAGTRIKVIDLAKELGVTSKDLMLAAEEMGHKGVRAMSPLDMQLANALRVKLGRGREIPTEDAKPKRVRKPKTEGAVVEGAVTEHGIVVKKPARARKKAGDEAHPAEVRPAATIVKPRPAETVEPEEQPAPEVAKPAAEILKPIEPPTPVIEPPVERPAAPAPAAEPMRPAPPAPPAPATPPPAPPAPVVPKKPEPRIVPFRPPERHTPPPRRPSGPFSPPRVTVSPARPTPPPRPAFQRPRPVEPAAAPPAPVVPATPPPTAPPRPAVAEPLAPAASVVSPPVTPAPVTPTPAPVTPAPVTAPAAPVAEAPAAEAKRELIRVPESVTLAELAEKMRRKSGEVIKALLELGVLRMVNDLLDPTEAKLVADRFGFDLEIRSVEGDIVEEEEDPTQLRLRPPVVTVMGHVDHGKTSLLDAIRRTRVAEKEFGGITQHIGAYQVVTSHGKVTFLDTPGHEAFTAMRARGAQATDIVILVVAADDGVMPQTVEALNHAKAANVPIIVAVNKIDKPESDPDRVKRELANHELLPEEWGGQTIFVPTSAKKGTGIDQLLEMAAIQAEVLELKANPNRAARGVIIESRLDRGRGPVATVLVRNGTLREGDAVVAGSHSGRVRALIDQSGKKVKAAGPADPVEILGLSGVPSAGDVLVAVSDERKARQIATMRQEKEKQKIKAATRVTLESLHKQIQTGEVKELRLVLKADVQGSVEAVGDALERLSTDEVKLKVIHASVGAINESDVMLASASNAIVLGFNVKADPKAQDQARANGVDIRYYNVIYEALNDLKAALAGMLAPEIRETVHGVAEVRQIFVISKLGPICGSYVREGKAVRSAKVRVRRGDTVVGEGTVSSLKRFKDDVREVLTGLECGIGVDGVAGIQPGDLLELFTTEEVARTL
ncbi:MAG: translation initiation factor IF-2 [Candidatus Rokubacteria bacterium]|nr:translation initiation factor IF-2 [Candidatus Rokubacteria bacterium]